MTGTEPGKGRRKTGAGVAGAGCGTVLTYAIQTFMPADSGAKQLLLYLVPMASVGLGFASFFIQGQVSEWWQAKEAAKRQARDDAVREDAEKIAKGVLADDNMSERTKKIVRRKLEVIRMDKLDNAMKRVKRSQTDEDDWKQGINTNEHSAVYPFQSQQ